MFKLKPFLLLLFVAVSLSIVTACSNNGDAGENTPAAATAEATQANRADTPQSGAAVPAIREESALTTAEIAERLRPSIVRVQTESASLDVFGRTVPSGGVGTGVIIDQEGHIVTNNHVVTVGNGNQPADNITVTLADGRAVSATIVGRDQATDLAVLKIDEPDLQPASFGDAAELRVGQDVVAIGFALDLEGAPTVTRGVVSAKNRTIQEQPYTIPNAIQTDAGINPGNSGGPLVNARGEIVGINTAIIRGAQSIGFSISSELVEPTVATLIKDGRIQRAYLGVGTVDVNEAIARTFNLPVEEGIAINLVAPGSPADGAGLRQNDVIISIGGEQVANNGELLAILASRRPGETVQVEYYRGSERNSVDVTLATRPDE